MADSSTTTQQLRAGEIHFPEGIAGFADAHRFELIDIAENGEAAFQLLRSTDVADVSLIVTQPWLFFPDYAPELDEQAEEDLGLNSAADAVVFCPVTLENDSVFVNLLGPFVVNANSLVGRQLVLADSDWPVRAAVEFESNNE